MTREEVRKELETILTIVDEKLVKTVEVRDETPIREGLGLDSLQITEVLFEIEERLSVKIADEEARTLRTVGDLITMVAAKGPKAAGDKAE